MSREHAISVEGSIVELMPNYRCRVRMPNGHHIVAHLASKLRLAFVKLDIGDRVKVTMSPFDLSKGTIIEHIAS
ncbi:MAG: Translation initiation factor IF-1 [Verrucomicrobia subdivision 3 bacterium]|nr:Translation initiation factor IF-1 [Limisphaerales bacterium]MCS1415981.1 Translation initiation factor IF-1 [Limisphaerales bacterium]